MYNLLKFILIASILTISSGASAEPVNGRMTSEYKIDANSKISYHTILNANRRTKLSAFGFNGDIATPLNCTLESGYHIVASSTTGYNGICEIFITPQTIAEYSFTIINLSDQSSKLWITIE